ncbi:MAG TPA: extracellular solute-binding protein [Rhizomicrobium sp.]|jgi:putative spermidine/putrescine transport system substrate-binding protein|nr:extracellular solute-binding protein [Rhizomicrobium sp.]
MRRRVLFPLALIMIAAVAALYWFSRPAPILTVTTWAGAYGRAQAAALMRPYAAEKSVDVRIAQWDGDLGEVEAAVNARKYKGDVIDFELPRAVEACRKGLLERIDPDILPDRRDFVPGAIGPCWVGSMVYSQVMIYSPRLRRAPRTLADFFDRARFPGRRALSRASAKYNLEMALLADGVPPSEVYRTLATPEGLDRAFAKLKALNPIWAHDSIDALHWVKNGQAVMATALNGDVYDSAKKDFAPGILWDRQLYEFDVFAIPSGDPNKKRALDFIAWATGAAPLAAMADWVPYGPARRSALALVKNNPELGTPMRPWLPTAPAHFARAFAVDDGWWLDHGAALGARWQQFVSR